MKRIAVVGATGAVGEEFGRVLAQRDFPIRACRLLASPRSAGREIEWADETHRVESLTTDSFREIDIAFFSAGASISREFAPLAAQSGALVVDNSSAFRMTPGVPLVVPEVNPQAAREHRGIIANPNCSTIILVVPLWPLHRANPVQRVVVSTYQAASGAGARALEELEGQTKAVLAGEPVQPKVFHTQAAFNVFSHNSAVGEDGYNVEETKMVLETRRIFGDDSIRVAPTCMRVPVMRAHTESVSVEFTRPMSEAQAREILAAAPGIKLVDDRAKNKFPEPLEATDRDEVLVGRIRQDPSVPDGRGVQFICAGDQLRKGAALNAVQIAELFL